MTPTGNGVWTWADRNDSAAERCVDMAAGMFSKSAVHMSQQSVSAA